VTEQTRIMLILILCLILFAGIALYGSTLMFKRAMRQVLKMFRNHEAFSAEKALFADELGMKAQGFIRFNTWRDYKPNAMDLLIKNDIVKVTEEGKLFLSEDNLANSGFEAKINARKK
jgi:hypothetical protein